MGRCRHLSKLRLSCILYSSKYLLPLHVILVGRAVGSPGSVFFQLGAGEGLIYPREISKICVPRIFESRYAGHDTMGAGCCSRNGRCAAAHAEGRNLLSRKATVLHGAEWGSWEMNAVEAMNSCNLLRFPTGGQSA
ncbi:hypothetical protein BJY00DRAFT_249336 [Aspergillus carlsbadensis]|nr:hypothetical protein BJY00DRAFT_249336 [Aspergillus carlsbadensis]